jgi:hypothetical protein
LLGTGIWRTAEGVAAFGIAAAGAVNVGVCGATTSLAGPVTGLGAAACTTTGVFVGAWAEAADFFKADCGEPAGLARCASGVLAGGLVRAARNF